VRNCRSRAYPLGWAGLQDQRVRIPYEYYRPGTRGQDEEVEEVIAHGVVGRGGGLLGVSGNPQRPPVRPITGTPASPRCLSNLPRERNLEEDYE
jgi:hypothetical protein